VVFLACVRGRSKRVAPSAAMQNPHAPITELLCGDWRPPLNKPTCHVLCGALRVVQVVFWLRLPNLPTFAQRATGSDSYEYALFSTLVGTATSAIGQNT